MSVRHRIDQQPAWVLHARPWRETSLILDVFSRDHGRLAMVAKGARRPTSQFRGLLIGFQPLLLDWSGNGEVKTLVRAEWIGGQPLLAGQALLCGYYLNELLLRLTAREDPHPELFEAYREALSSLTRVERFEPVLRRFELILLQELGYCAHLGEDAEAGEPLQAEARYAFIIEHGPVPDELAPAGLPRLKGRCLAALEARDFSDPDTLREARPLLRMLIDHYLGAQPLQSRRILMELQTL